ncbi:MAG: DUF3417 domain-containing protein [Acidimicrobiales bacterium]
MAGRLPAALAPLAAVAYNYRWSWVPGGARTFAAIDPDRWERCGANPVRLLLEAPAAALRRAAATPEVVRAAEDLAADLRADKARPSGPFACTPRRRGVPLRRGSPCTAPCRCTRAGSGCSPATS